MPYTRPWAEVSFLLGTRVSHEIDDAAREVHVDLEERLNDILHGGAAADPWKVKVPGVNADGTFNMVLHPSMGTVVAGTGDFNIVHGALQPSAASGSVTWRGGFPVTRGSTIKGATFTVSRSVAGASVTVRIVKVNYSAVGPSGTVVATASADVNTPGQSNSVVLSGLTEVLSATDVYFMEVILVADASGADTARLFAVDVNFKASGV